ncbi:Gamma-secretase-activating protein [Sciurus carolinensis]|uniref:Gamma-secretase-activating protein n=1 Tax=Sciurus carolinensis TaxID=30640 RepID=A0AA41NBE3_SCICA|nr:Gamma-secretase-activating protein [Sciurus carolinensis]
MFTSKSLLFSVGSKCLTLLVEIHPVNNVKVLKAVDSYIWVQVIKNSGHLPRDRIAEDFVWVQWDMSEQRLYYIDLKGLTTHSLCWEGQLVGNLVQEMLYLSEFPPPPHLNYDVTSLDGCHVVIDGTFASLHALPNSFAGNDKMNDMLPHSSLQSLSGSLVLDWYSGTLYRALLDQSYLLRFLWNTCLDCEKMAILHCVLSCGRDPQFLEGQEIPGITLVTEEIELPLMKVHSFKGYWEKLNSNLDYVKYAKPYLRYNNSVVKREWHNLISEEVCVGQGEQSKQPTHEPRLTLLLQENDNHQKLLLGLLDLICRLVETCWRRHDLQSWVFHFNRPCSAAEFAVFHIMTRILEATNSLFLPLPPGFHTLHTILGVHCLPLHNLLDYIDNGVLLLTETAVTRLMKDLDNSEKNEKLKFSILVRLPPHIGQKICRVWDHPMSSNIISRTHVTQLLQNYKKQSRNSVMDKSSFSVEFLPLNYFIEILTDLESSNQGNSLLCSKGFSP